MGKEFLKIIDQSFPVGNPLHGKLTRHNMKLAYSTTTNMSGKISQHNQKLLSAGNVEQVDPCVCTQFDCPLDGRCEIMNVVYQASVTTPDDGHTEHYVGVTHYFKERFIGHRSDMRHSENRHGSTLSKYVWELKDAGRQFDMQWRIIDRGAPYNNVTKRCILCDKEKYYIIYHRDMSTLNKRSKLFNVCKHRTKHLLSKA